MSKDQDLAATVAKLASTVENLSAQVERLSKVNRQKLDSEITAERVLERDRKLTAVAKIDDHAERAKAIGALHTLDDVKYALGELDVEQTIATLEAATPHDRQKMLNSLPPARETELAISRLPAPHRIVARLTTGMRRLHTPPLRGVTKAESYGGFALEAGDRHVELASTFKRRVEIDEALREAIERGQVVVEDMPEAESRHLLRCEVLSREPDQRPLLRFEQ